MKGGSPGQNMLQILYAQDSVANCAAMKEFLEQSGPVQQELGPCVVTTVHSGKAALEHAEQQTFDVVMADCHLPDMSGLEITQDLLEQHPECPVFLMVNKGAEHLALEAISLEVTDYIVLDENRTYFKFAPILIKKLLARAKARKNRIKAEQKIKKTKEKLEQRVERRTRELAAQSYLLEHSLNALNQGFIVWDPDDRLVICNRRFHDLFGLPPGTLKPGITLYELLLFLAKDGYYGKGDPEKLAQKKHAEIMVERQQEKEVRVTENNRVLEISQYQDDNLGRIATFTDITEIHHREREAAMLQEALNNFTDSVILYDHEERVVFTNKQYHETYPASPAQDQIAGHTMAELLQSSLNAGQINHPLAKTDPDAWLAQRLKERRENMHTQGETVHANGRSYFYKVSKSSSGGHIHIQSEITEQKKAEEALRISEERLQAQVNEFRENEVRMEAQAADLVLLAENLSEAHDKLARLNEQKDKFFSIIAHDLKGPFNALLGFSSLLSGQGETLSPEKTKEYGTLVHQSAEQVFKLLENLLEWSLLQMGRMKYEPGPVELKDVIQANKVLFTTAADKKGITFICNPTDYIALADYNMIDTIIRNLINNAIKFTPEGGTVTIDTRNNGDFIELEVSDTGIGIAPDQVSKLFRLDENISTKGTDGEIGTGLGLHLCKDLIEHQGGKIHVLSDRKQGATFRITLPVYPAELLSDQLIKRSPKRPA
ncbi:hybrid sensor histidine kinase/response regulator [Kiloniella litopenaei]|uniref:hybrid sensor histidine kinase/response regulator n=1 Tax=Kiloniella litopenaei TaxID=1549748 RepID=UPI0006979468|nr:PAS-domain containing protein [Kiloniella litopenaei]